MFQSHTSRSLLRYVTPFVVAVPCALCPMAMAQQSPPPTLTERMEAVENRLIDVEERLSILESGRTCADEYEQALEYTTMGGQVDDYSVPSLWDGTPFQVMVSNALPNYGNLVQVIADEAARIKEALGYEVFVALGSARYEIVSRSDFNVISQGRQHVPPGRIIEIRCCDERGIGTAYPWFRVILLPALANDDAAFLGGHARINLIHELYHVLGFRHSDETEGVTMSYPLDLALENPLDEYGNIVGEWYDHTLSTSVDWANLACIYGEDAGIDQVID